MLAMYISFIIGDENGCKTNSVFYFNTNLVNLVPTQLFYSTLIISWYGYCLFVVDVRLCTKFNANFFQKPGVQGKSLRMGNGRGSV